MRRLDLAGKRYGDLEVIEMAGRTKKGAVKWRCLCHRCGKEVEIEGHRIVDKRNQKVDCGCLYKEKRADLSGKKIGVLDVIEYKRTSENGDRLYLCRCHLCGGEKILPASTIRAKLASCGCRQYDKERMAEISKLGIAETVIDGVNVPHVFRQQANRNSSSGIRGVTKIKDGMYRASCQVHGERWIREGFKTAEDAKKARKEKQEELIKKYNVKPLEPDQET